jgi:hypothetical protein
VRWQRLAEAFPWRTAAMLAGFAASLWFLWWTWFAQELSPLERYYWPTYFSSTEGAKQPSSTTLIAPLFMTSHGRKSEIALAPDVDRGRTGNLPLQLSQSAVDRGWTGIEKAQPMQVESGALEDLLRERFYAGQGFWHMTVEPILDGCAYLLVWIVIAIVFVRRGLAVEWKELWTVLAETDSTSDYNWDTPGNRRGIVARLGLRWNLRDWVENLFFRPVRTVHQSSRPIDAKRDSEAIRGDLGRDQPLTPAPMPPESAPQLRLETPPINHPKRPAQPRFIFPGRAGIRSASRQPKPWDESQWID